MKNIIRKTAKERDEVVTYKLTKVKHIYQIPYYYWACEKCNIAYFAEDEILVGSDGGHKCPNHLKTIWGRESEKICKEDVRGGDEECFNRYYKIT